ncbi:MFS transporter [Erwinia pyrifoliae]|uniref:MFS transporter n=1 Tax=Erwinia pyrifoliae TaxID=79967 RepID=UPI00220B0AEF|nr:MFS transporter [Erwinia pyrifoliae]UWS31551.1 MFS transporter [Erwinia pyrifoliae]
MDVPFFVSGSLVTEHAPRAVLLFADIGKLPGDCVCNRAIANGRVRLLLFLSATLSAACRRVHALMIFGADNALPALPDAVVKRHEMPSNLTISIITIIVYGYSDWPHFGRIYLFFCPPHFAVQHHGKAAFSWGGRRPTIDKVIGVLQHVAI